MDRIVFLTPDVAVTGALSPADFADIARRGFRALISTRPDGEEPGQLSRLEEAVHAWRSGLVFRHVPAAKHELFDDCVVDAMADALTHLPGPVLLHCKSGQRSAILWAAALARRQPVDGLLATLKAAGFDLDALREDFAAQADRVQKRAPERSVAA